MRLGEQIQGEMLCVRADGSRFWLSLQVIPAPDSPGRPHQVVLLGYDVTQDRMSDQQDPPPRPEPPDPPQRPEPPHPNLFTRAVKAVNAAVAIVGMDGRIVMANPVLQRLLGRDAAALDGTQAADLLHPADRAELQRAMARRPDDGSEHHQCVRLRQEPGLEVVADLTLASLDPADGPPMHVVTLHDLTPRAEAFQVAGNIRMIGLAEVKAVLGARWPALRERALAAAEHVLSRRLGPKDTFSRTRDDGFLICFADLQEDAASFTAAMIGREIRARLIGQGEEAETSQVVAITAKVALPPVSEGGGGPDHGPAPRVAGESAALRDVIEQRLDSQRAGIEAQARETLSEAMATASCVLSPVVGRDGRQVVAHYARLPTAMHRRLAVAAAALPDAERRRYDLDVLALRLAGAQALERVLRDRNGSMFLDVSFDVFDSRLGTECYLDTCRKLDMSIRQGLVLVLTQLPQGLTSRHLLDSVHLLRPFCRAIGFELNDVDPPDLDPTLAKGAFLMLDAQRLPVAHVPSSRMERLTHHAHGKRSRVLICGVTERQVAGRLLASGVDLIAMNPTPQG
jgi:PAS domain S-box-containing protein